MSQLKKMYDTEIVKELMSAMGYTNRLAVPRIIKITLNMGVGEAALDKAKLKAAMEDLEKIAGQKPIQTLARVSNAGFKIREGWPIGCKVTLRGQRMYDFLERLLWVAIPRVRDFRGLNPRSFDGRGNFSMGVTEQIVFPEVDYDKVDSVRGLDICIATTANTNEEGLALLKAFRFPFKDIQTAA